VSGETTVDEKRVLIEERVRLIELNVVYWAPGPDQAKQSVGCKNVVKKEEEEAECPEISGPS
jgi:hypothetical protein